MKIRSLIIVAVVALGAMACTQKEELVTAKQEAVNLSNFNFYY